MRGRLRSGRSCCVLCLVKVGLAGSVSVMWSPALVDRSFLWTSWAGSKPQRGALLGNTLIRSSDVGFIVPQEGGVVRPSKKRVESEDRTECFGVMLTRSAPPGFGL